MLSKVILFFAIISVALAAVALGPHPPKPDKFKDVPGCYIEDWDEVIPIGQTKSSKTQCLQYDCRSDVVQYESCGVAVAQPPCKLVEDKSLPYPRCCPKLEC